MSTKNKRQLLEEEAAESPKASKKSKIGQNVNIGFYLTKLSTENPKLSKTKETNTRTLHQIDITLSELFEGPLKYATLLTFLIEIEWLFKQVPKLKDALIKTLIVYDKESCPNLEKFIKANKLNNFILHGPRKPITYGVHHSKAFILVFETKIRIVVLTANLISMDWGKKTQGVWFQDFPLKKKQSQGGNGTKESSEFESDLIEYLMAYRIGKTHETELLSYIRKFDFSMANVKLITSVPGYHGNIDVNKYGHMKVRDVLKNETLDEEFGNNSIACQFSSLGSINEKWLQSEFMESLSQGQIRKEENVNVYLVWPTVEDIRTSLEGWESGLSFPGKYENVHRCYVKRLYNKINLDIIKRDRAMPHIKTYTRFSKSGNLAWVLLGSHNLSKAAWGTLQKNKTQLMIRSYELSVLFIPSLRKKYFKNQKSIKSEDEKNEDKLELNDEMQFKPINIKNEGFELDENHIYYPLPYQIPPCPYKEEDEAWICDDCYSQKDILGKNFN